MTDLLLRVKLKYLQYSPLVWLSKSERRQQHAAKETEFLRLKRSRLGVDDFESLKVIGRGAFGEEQCWGLVTRQLPWLCGFSDTKHGLSGGSSWSWYKKIKGVGKISPSMLIYRSCGRFQFEIPLNRRVSLGGPGRVAHPITGHFYLGSLCCCCGDLIGGSGNGGGGGDGGDGDGDGVAPIPIPLSSLWAARVLPETIDESFPMRPASFTELIGQPASPWRNVSSENIKYHRLCHSLAVRIDNQATMSTGRSRIRERWSNQDLTRGVSPSAPSYSRCWPGKGGDSLCLPELAVSTMTISDTRAQLKTSLVQGLGLLLVVLTGCLMFTVQGAVDGEPPLDLRN
ncbi:hypothetical protein RRG08_049594 [Elysia crispata]|uniref:Uncharacterized protein n=1 Tax=Elysia crispata TaxID=231223 RepID=A0AAE1AUY5_9GAST|nr:hypothetical protein RRG08_049594 [Elysia crispata]